MNYLSILGLIFLIWQLGAIWRFKNLDLNQMIKTTDLGMYQWNMWSSAEFFMIIVALKWFDNRLVDSLTTNAAILSFVFVVQFGFCFYIVKYKSIMRDFEIIADLKRNGNERQGREKLSRLYEKMHRILLLLLKSYLRNNAYIDRNNNDKELVYEESTVTYLMERFEALIRDFGLAGSFSMERERKKLVEQVRSSKL